LSIRTQGQLLALAGQLVAAAREFLFVVEQREAGCEPLVSGYDFVWHGLASLLKQVNLKTGKE
jgi:hypothetical protein